MSTAGRPPRLRWILSTVVIAGLLLAFSVWWLGQEDAQATRAPAHSRRPSSPVRGRDRGAGEELRTGATVRGSIQSLRGVAVPPRSRWTVCACPGQEGERCVSVEGADFELDGAPGCPVFIWGPGGPPTCTPPEAVPGAPLVLRVRLLPVSGALPVRVVDAHDEPVEGALVRVASHGETGGQMQPACRTDERGRCRLQPPRIDAEEVFQVLHPDYGTLEETRWVDPAGMRFVLAPGAVVRGVAVGVGEPVGLGVRLLWPGGDPLGLPRGTTQAQGRFRLAGVAPGMYRLRIVGSGVSAMSGEFSVAGGEELDLGEIELHPSATLRVTIVSDAISCRRGRARLVGEQIAASSDPSGVVVFPAVMPGEYRLKGTCFEPFAGSTEVANMLANAGVQEVTVDVGEVQWREGEVRFDHGMVPDGPVRVVFRADRSSGGVFTDGEQMFRFAIPATVESCQVRVEDSSFVSEAVDCVSRQKLELRAQARAEPVRVRVVDRGGAPVPGAEVWVGGPRGTLRPVGVVGPGGVVTVGRRDPAKVQEICARLGEIDACADTTAGDEVQIELPCAGGHEVRGRIETSADPRDARVWAESTTAPGPPLAQTRADAEGSFTLHAPGCVPSRVVVELLAGGRGTSDLSPERDETEVVVRVPSPGAVQGVLTCAGRAGPARVELLREGAFFPERTVWLGPDEVEVEFSGVPPASYRLRATGHEDKLAEVAPGVTSRLQLQCAGSE